MTLSAARWLIVVVGVLLPYLVRLPGGWDWVDQSQPLDWESGLLIGGWNAIVWVALLLISLAYRYPVSLLPPVLAGFGFVGYWHAVTDLREDAQSAIALILIPLYALAPIAVGAVLGGEVDWWLRRRGRTSPPAEN